MRRPYAPQRTGPVHDWGFSFSEEKVLRKLVWPNGAPGLYAEAQGPAHEQY